MSSKRGRFGKRSPSATPPDITYTDPVNCQWGTCMKQFSCITDLAQHIEKTHVLKGVMKDNVCLWRNCRLNMKPFKDRYILAIHLRKHSGEKSHRCPYQGCNKILANVTNLKVHLQRHTGEMPHRCRIIGCNKSFVNSAECSQHEKTHSGERFPCTYLGCDREYTVQKALNRHIVLKHTQGEKPPTKTSDKLDNCHPVQDLHDNSKALKKKHHTHNNKRQRQPYKVDKQATPLIATPPQQYPCHTHTGNRYLHLPFPVFGLPDINTIFDAQDLVNHLPNNSHYTDMPSYSSSPYQSPQLPDLSLNIYNPKRLVMPSLSSQMSSTNIQFHPQSTYIQHIPSLLPSNEDIQYMHYMSPLTTNQQPIMSPQEDYFAIPTSSMFN